MKRKEQIAVARKMAISDLTREAEHRRQTARAFPASQFTPYRREIARLWTVALRAAKAAAK